MIDKTESLMRWIEWPEWAQDAVVTDVVDIKFDWWERLLILIGRPVTVSTKAHTEHRVGRSEGQARVTVAPIHWPWRRQILGQVEAARAE